MSKRERKPREESPRWHAAEAFVKNGSKFTDRWVAHTPLPQQSDKPNQWTFSEKLGTKKGARSLLLVVGYAGSKAWRVLWYENKKGKSAKLGAYPEMSIAAARKAAEAYEPAREEARKAAGTFREVAEAFVQQYVKKLDKNGKPLKDKKT